MQEKAMDAVLLTSRENYYYISGFSGTSAHLIITMDEALLFTDFRYWDQAKVEAKDFSVMDQEKNMAITIKSELQKRDIQILGFEEDDFSIKQFHQYQEILGIQEWKPLEQAIQSLRMYKDAHELHIIQKAVSVAEHAFSHVLSLIKPGVREYEIAAELEYFMRKQGATGASFDTIVASGYRSALPHGVASDKVIELGEVITIDFGAKLNGYCSDMTRTVFLGQPNPEISKIYDVVKLAQETAVIGAKASMLAKDLDSIAREIIAKAGFAESFGHGLGHGVGIDVHEEPRVSPRGEMMLRNQMIVTIEPGIYVTGLGGVRIEDMVMIHDDNPIILTNLSKEKIIL